MTPNELEERRVSIEERRIEGDIRLRSEDLALRREQYEATRERHNLWSRAFSPVGVAVIAAIIGLFGNLAARVFDSTVERRRQESALILKLSEISDEEQRSKNILYFAERGFLRLSAASIASVRKLAEVKAGEPAPLPVTVQPTGASHSLRLERQSTTAQGTFGKLYLDKNLAGVTLEQANSTTASDGRIPPGVYPFTVTFSEVFKRPMVLILNVPNHSGLRILPGNSLRDFSGGSIAIGEAIAPAKGEITGSRAAFSGLMEALGPGARGTLEIVNKN